MSAAGFPPLETPEIAATRDALHGYSRVLGSWLEACRPRRKHWWHVSLRPSLQGLRTGPVHGAIDFELELDLRDSALRCQVAGGAGLVEALHGQPAAELADRLRAFLLAEGIASAPENIPAAADDYAGYSPAAATAIADAWLSITRALAQLRAETPEETSPIQLWPHHFDLSMLWLPGEKIPGHDPADEEHADKQVNFGFTLGDLGIAEPYFYATAYPLPDAFSDLPLPYGTNWRSEGFTGAVTLYRDLLQQAAPGDYLLGLWRGLLEAGREHMLIGN